MALQTRTFVFRDGNGGSYTLAITEDVVSTRVTVTEVSLDNSLRSYDTRWTLDVNAHHYEGTVVAGQAQTWSGLNERTDNRDIVWTLG